MSGGSKTTTQQTQTNTIDPELKAKYLQNYATAQQNAGQVAQPYTGQLVAGFNPTQVQAQGILSGIGTDPTYLNQIEAGANATQGVLNSDPLSGANLQQYENPYQKDVIDASIAQNERARQIAQTQMNAHNAAGGAFGGSRSGVANALTNEAYDRNNQTNIANLNASNYSNAEQAALAASGLKLGAAQQLGQFGNAGLNTATQQAGILGAVGDTQQNQSQNELSMAYQNWLTGKQLTMDQQNLLNSALGMIPVEQTIQSNGTSETKSSPGIGGILGGLGSIAMSAAMPGSAGLFGGTSLLGSMFGGSKSSPFSFMSQ